MGMRASTHAKRVNAVMVHAIWVKIARIVLVIADLAFQMSAVLQTTAPDVKFLHAKNVSAPGTSSAAKPAGMMSAQKMQIRTVPMHATVWPLRATAVQAMKVPDVKTLPAPIACALRTPFAAKFPGIQAVSKKPKMNVSTVVGVL